MWVVPRIFAPQIRIMRVLSLLALGLCLSGSLVAQKKKSWTNIDLNKAGDHFMISYSVDGWTGMPDSISSRKKGLARGFNFALMMNKPFKTDPRWSVAFGVGVSNSNMFFQRLAVDVAASGDRLPFRNLDGQNAFKKYKLATTFLEVPVELRFMFRPDQDKKSWKIALGAKVGTLVNAHTKGKNLQDATGRTINSAFIEKESKRIFFNNIRFAGTARVGIGNFSLFGSYALTTLLKDNAGPEMRPFQIGLCVSGL